MLAFLRNQTTPKKYNNLTYRKNNKRSISNNNENSFIHTSDTSLIFKKTKNNLKKIILANKTPTRQFTAKIFNHSRNYINNKQLTLQIENKNLKEKLTTLNGQIKMKNNEIIKLQTESKKKKNFYIEMKKNYLKSLENLGKKVQKIKRTISCENIQEKNEKYEKILKENKSKDIIIKNLNKKLLRLEKIIENKNNIIANLTTTNFNMRNNINNNINNNFNNNVGGNLYNKIITEDNNISQTNQIYENKNKLTFSIKKSIPEKDSFFNSDIEENVINIDNESKIKKEHVMTLENLNESIKLSFYNKSINDYDN
jgi:hypothetical protein